MSVSKCIALVAVVLSSLAWAEKPQGEVVIRTRDGREYVGRVLTETSTGYLVAGPKGSRVVNFTDMVEIAPVGPPPVSADAPPPPPPPSVPAPVVVAPMPPPAPPAPLVEAPPQLTAVSADDWATRRQGFHFGLGVSGMFLPFEIAGSAVTHLDWSFGKVALDIAPRVGVLATELGGYVNVGLDTQVRFALTEGFSLGFGIDQGLMFGTSDGYYAGLSLTPVLVTLGDRGQHQLSLWACVPLLRLSNGGGFLPFGTLGYAYLF